MQDMSVVKSVMGSVSTCSLKVNLLMSTLHLSHTTNAPSSYSSTSHTRRDRTRTRTRTHRRHSTTRARQTQRVVKRIRRSLTRQSRCSSLSRRTRTNSICRGITRATQPLTDKASNDTDIQRRAMVEVHRVRGNECIGVAAVRLWPEIDGWVAAGAEVEGCGTADFGRSRRNGGVTGGLLRFAL
jgi:hypothetical protein